MMRRGRAAPTRKRHSFESKSTRRKRYSTPVRKSRSPAGVSAFSFENLLKLIEWWMRRGPRQFGDLLVEGGGTSDDHELLQVWFQFLCMTAGLF